jgi:hypothetical protein
MLRAMRLLETIGGAEARRLLARLAGGAEQALLTKLARDALKRSHLDPEPQ